MARPQASSLGEASRTLDELAEAGVTATHLVLNGVLPAEAIDDELGDAIRASEGVATANMPENLKSLVTDRLALRSHLMVGVDALGQLLCDAPSVPSVPEHAPAPADANTRPLSRIVDELAQKDHGLIMVVGKGWVGKTTMASALALALADRGKDVLLTTTDPAAHLAWTLGAPTGFEVSSINPARAVAEYRQRVMGTKGANLDEEGRANLAEDLRSPCTEEVAIFQAFSAAVQQPDRRFVVMDTAPTGHTLLLMDATGSYHREVVCKMPHEAEVTPLARLPNAEETSVIVVALPETVPVLEAEGLVADLARAEIATWGWIVNRSLTPTGTASPLLGRRIASEQAPLAQVKAMASRLAVVPYRATQRVGTDELRALTSSGRRLSLSGGPLLAFNGARAG